jgi:predicted chitinase
MGFRVGLVVRRVVEGLAPVSAEAAFDVLRSYKRELTGEGLSQADVDALNALFATWKPALSNPRALSDAAKFYDVVRIGFGRLTVDQVNGINRLLQAYGVARWPIAFAAYGLATAWRETNKQMQPVEEGYYLGDRADAYRKKLRYYPWFGRGDVQCTWEANYRAADVALGLGGALVADPNLALKPDISARMMVWGMEHGAFTGKKLADYLPSAGKADIHQFTNARRIINGLDAAVEIAGNALKFQDALEAGGWQ